MYFCIYFNGDKSDGSLKELKLLLMNPILHNKAFPPKPRDCLQPAGLSEASWPPCLPACLPSHWCRAADESEALLSRKTTGARDDVPQRARRRAVDARQVRGGDNSS